jgi:GNAT superfamily N-acetyltransferase
MEWAEDDDLLVEFTMRLMEIDLDTPAEGLVHEINGAIKLRSPEGEEQPIGTLTASLFNIAALVNADIYLLEPYDMREAHLAETIKRIFDFKHYEFHPTIVRKTGFFDADFIEWHLHAFHLYVQAEHRGRRRGVRTLRLLREFARRPGLLSMAKAFPREPDGHDQSTGEVISALARYYLSEKGLGFRQLGRLDQGWLVANWSN